MSVIILSLSKNSEHFMTVFHSYSGKQKQKAMANSSDFFITYDTIWSTMVNLMSHFGSSEEKTKFALIRIDLSIKTWVY